MYDQPFMQNSLRGLWAEVMVSELLGDRWRHVGADWAAWDIERDDGLRLEVKQSAQRQSWGMSKSASRFGIAAPKGYYPDGVTYTSNESGNRLADIYVFAWHDGQDQRRISEWSFFPLAALRLLQGQKTIGLSQVKGLTDCVNGQDLCRSVTEIADQLPAAALAKEPIIGAP